jgi:hypothetical protein
MNVVGEFINYDGLHAILRQRADELQISRELIDEISGMQPGYSSKLLSVSKTKMLGAVTMPLLLPALGLKLQVVEDPEAMERIRSRLTPRNASQARMQTVKAGRYGHLISKRFLRSIAFLGGRAYAQKVPAKRRREIARNAALARWKDIKAAVKNA